MVNIVYILLSMNSIVSNSLEKVLAWKIRNIGILKRYKAIDSKNLLVSSNTLHKLHTDVQGDDNTSGKQGD